MKTLLSPPACSHLSLCDQASTAPHCLEHRLLGADGSAPAWCSDKSLGAPSCTCPGPGVWHLQLSGAAGGFMNPRAAEACSRHGRNWSLCAAKKDVLFFCFCFCYQRTGSKMLTNTKSQNANPRSRKQTHIWASSLKKKNGVRLNYPSLPGKY